MKTKAVLKTSLEHWISKSINCNTCTHDGCPGDCSYKRIASIQYYAVTDVLGRLLVLPISHAKGISVNKLFFRLSGLCLLQLALFTPAQAQLASCASSASLQADAVSAAEVIFLAGQGQQRDTPQLDWQSLRLADHLRPGSEVRTLERSSAALLLADATQLRMAAQAYLRLCEGQSKKSRLQLIVGRLWARTKARVVDLELQTPSAIAAVRGTDWDIEVSAEGTTTLSVMSGRIEVSNEFGQVTVGPTEQAIVKLGEAPVKRILVNPRERVQWVMAPSLVAARWPELRKTSSGWWQAALQAMENGQFKQLNQQVDARLQQQTDDALALRLKAELELAAGDLDAATQHLLYSWQQSADAAAAARYAQLLRLRDQSAAAQAFLQQARQQAPSSIPLILATAEGLRLAGQGKAARTLYQQAVDQSESSKIYETIEAAGTAGASDPIDSSTEQLAAALAGLAQVQFEQGDLAAARTNFKKVLYLQPADSEYQALAANAAISAFDQQTAGQLLAKSMQQAPDDYVVLASQGLLDLQRNNTAEARQHFLKSLTIEPNYAYAQIGSAIAEYRLDNPKAAFDALQAARQADPLDPLSWQIEATLRNDQGDAEGAIEAARASLVRLPYLKSLNALSSDSQGNANLGKAFADFGLEHWARSYAQASYYPLWAGSHTFLAKRYESDYARSSELFMGYLSDPLLFGFTEKRPGLLQVDDREFSAGLAAGRDRRQDSLTADLAYRGFSSQLLPMTWMLRVDDVNLDPREGPALSQHRLRSPGLDLALGVRFNDQLSGFLLHKRDWMRYVYPRGLDFGNGISFTKTARHRSQRSDAGFSWRWSDTAQTWLKLHHARATLGLVLDNINWGPQSYGYLAQEDGVFIRHTQQFDVWRLSLGWEGVKHNSGSYILDDDYSSPRSNEQRYDMPWLNLAWQKAAWSAEIGVSWPKMHMSQSDAFRDTQTGEDLFPVEKQAQYNGHRFMPRLGLSYAFAPSRILHWAYQESLRANGTHTLSPVSTASIPIDFQYQQIGSRARKQAIQLGWELGPRSFTSYTLATQKIYNTTMQDGRLFALAGQEIFDNSGSLAPVETSAQMAIDPYQGDALFSRGRLDQASFALNQILSPKWSALAAYTWADSHHLADKSLRLPGVPRHTALLGSTWRHTGRDFSLIRLVYRGSRYADEENFYPDPASWTVYLAHALESSDRRWSLTATLQQKLKEHEKPAFWFLLRWRH